MTSELVDRLRAAPLTGRPPSFATAEVAYAVHDTALGRMLLARRDSGPLVASMFVTDHRGEDRALDRLASVVSPRVLRIPAALDDVRRRLDDYLAGSRRDLDVELDWALATRFPQGKQPPVLRSSLGNRQQTLASLEILARPDGVTRAGARHRATAPSRPAPRHCLLYTSPSPRD